MNSCSKEGLFFFCDNYIDFRY